MVQFFACETFLGRISEADDMDDLSGKAVMKQVRAGKAVDQAG